MREIRSRQNMPPKTPIEFAVRCDAATAELLRPMEPYFESMAGAGRPPGGPTVDAPPTSASVPWPRHGSVRRPGRLIDVEAEIARKTKELARLDRRIAGKEAELANANFVARAPAEVVEKERAALEQLKQSSRGDATLVGA